MDNIKSTFKQIIHKYGHAWVFLYGLIYLPWFAWLEKTVTTNFYVIHSTLDDHIPFIEYFIVPYLLWFLYVACTLLYFFFTDKSGFYKMVTLLFTGMTLFLIICTLFPNGLNLRPLVFERENIFVDLVRALYATDTPTNVLPSLHVYNSIGCYIAIRKSEHLQNNKVVQYGSLILTTLIVLSTMFLKQHSIIDVVAAFVMASFLYQLVYAPSEAKTATWVQQGI